ncbi:MAG: hypothetical protein IKH61_12975 [Bacteroidales bacterium]|nr:hypothetical protein [Bacteroidales bacterium]
MKNQELTISVENAIKAYNGTDDKGKKMLEALFGKETFIPKDIKDRIKTFDDACNALAEDNPLVLLYDVFQNEIATTESRNDDADVLAYLKLRIIAAALNEGWKPEFTEDEVRWYPWFWLYTKDEWNRLDEGVKKYGRVLGRSSYDGHVYGGLACANADVASSCSSTNHGSRLAFKSEELAEYCGKQFVDIWIDFLIGGNEE